MEKIAFMLSFLLFFASAAYSDIYKYTDENGVVCYTDASFGKKTEKVMRENKPSIKTAAPTLSPSYYEDYNSYVSQAASKYDIEPELIHAVIKTESNGNSSAISRKGAIGLMQLMPSTAVDMAVNPYNPEENIEGGVRYLRYLLERFNGDLTLALAAYNAGPKTVEKYGNVPPIAETMAYVKRVYSFYRGKKNYTVSDQPKQEASAASVTRVYKIVLDDGSTLFTNSSFAKTIKNRF